MRPICVPCQRFFRCTKTGFEFTEGMPKHNGAPPGTSAPDQWKPYKVWCGDEFTCEGCGTKVIVGVARQPIAEHFQPDFEVIRDRVGAARLQVNDC